MTNKKASISSPTNSLVITFTDFSAHVCDLLFEKLHEYGRIFHFSKLKSFKRCLVVFNSKSEAQAAKSALDGYEIAPGNSLKLFFSMNTDFSTIHDNFLAVPESAKLQLISPPGSPILGWTQQPEDCPNKLFMDNSLLLALQELKDGVYKLDMDDVVSVASFDADFTLDSQAARIKDDFPAIDDDDCFDTLPSQSRLPPSSFSSSPDSLSPSPSFTDPSRLQTSKTNFSNSKNVPTFIIEDFDKQSINDTNSFSMDNRCPTPLPKTQIPPSATTNTSL
ncbi:Calcipressin-like protein [Smittium culicis]|uniref:Calcipressin-like protein n=1 Tax=Smittium culicis TaxID=133412 RepID=A0A1R1XAH6_9FUNG|nr:Calcipressin-like protein [Smittium culicis]